MHVLVYVLATTLGWELFLGFIAIPLSTILLFGTVTFVTHWITDFITSRISTYCYLKMSDEKEKGDFWEFAFWSTIGFDQFIHALTLILTYKFLYPH